MIAIIQFPEAVSQLTIQSLVRGLPDSWEQARLHGEVGVWLVYEGRLPAAEAVAKLTQHILESCRQNKELMCQEITVKYKNGRHDAMHATTIFMAA